MSKLRNQPDDAASGCWVDLYSSSYFGGRLKRIYGPNYIRVGGTGSLIVGPEALILRAGRNPGVNLRPKQIIPDLNTTAWKGKLKSLKVLHMTSGLSKKDSDLLPTVTNLGIFDDI